MHLHCILIMRRDDTAICLGLMTLHDGRLNEAWEVLHGYIINTHRNSASVFVYVSLLTWVWYRTGHSNVGSRNLCRWKLWRSCRSSFPVTLRFQLNFLLKHVTNIIVMIAQPSEHVLSLSHEAVLTNLQFQWKEFTGPKVNWQSGVAELEV